MVTKILTDRVNFSNDVKEVRQEWLRGLFLYLGLNVDAMDNMSRGEMLDYMLDKDVQVIEHKSIDALEVLIDNNLVGEWAGPEYVLKIDSSKSLFFEATIEHWSIIEDEIDAKGD